MALDTSDLEEVIVIDQDTDNNVVECEESFCVLYFKNVYGWKCLVVYL